MSNSSCEVLSWSGKASCGIGKRISCALWKKSEGRCCYIGFVSLIRLLSIRSFRTDLNLLAREKHLKVQVYITGFRKGFMPKENIFYALWYFRNHLYAGTLKNHESFSFVNYWFLEAIKCSEGGIMKYEISRFFF